MINAKTLEEGVQGSIFAPPPIELLILCDRSDAQQDFGICESKQKLHTYDESKTTK
jgi:hypothetical protein